MSSRAKENIKLMEREIANNSTSNLSNITMHFAPVTTIQGNADRDTINQMDKFYEKYKERFMLDILREKNNL
jgi:3-keto-L-gulonate-6-phosphate decarboxylase